MRSLSGTPYPQSNVLSLCFSNTLCVCVSLNVPHSIVIVGLPLIWGLSSALYFQLLGVRIEAALQLDLSRHWHGCYVSANPHCCWLELSPCMQSFHALDDSLEGKVQNPYCGLHKQVSANLQVYFLAIRTLLASVVQLCSTTMHSPLQTFTPLDGPP